MTWLKLFALAATGLLIWVALTVLGVVIHGMVSG